MSKPKRNVRPKFENTRKTMRKQKRQQKKVNRQEHYLKKSVKKLAVQEDFTPGKFVRRPAESPERNVEKKKKKSKVVAPLDILNDERIKETKATEKLKRQMGERRKNMLLQANEDEDKVIKKLEKQLGLNKTKNKTKNFASDGLDYLLEICDRSKSEQIVAAEKHLAGVEGDSDFEEDLAAVTEKPSKSQKANAKVKTTEKEMKVILKNPPSKKIKIVSEEDLDKVFSDDEVSHLSGDDDEMLNDGGDEGKVEEIKEKPDMWEDIYGRKRDKEGNVIKEEKGVYVPPHLRNKDTSSDKQLMQLKRQIKSVLNKLAGTNLHWASSSLETLYANNSRHSVNSTLTQLWLDACGGASSTPDRMVAEHAALVSVLHANVGSEIGAHFLQELSKRFNEMIQSPQPVENKMLDNLVSCLAYLYGFKIYHASLLYDILTRLLEVLSEKNIECVLVALRSVGGVLRKEEPLALKNFIHDTQARVAKLNEASVDGSRIKFLLEVLMAVKNNNLMKIPNYDPSYAEHLKKMTRSIIRKGNYITPLNIRLEDLLKADERGKWWVVGSAWEGNITRPEEKPSAKLVPTTDQKLLELARQQRMNTDVRRSIFCILMSAEDYLDAFEKLQHLGLKGQQEREIIHVLLSCCLQERIYNPYYAVLAQKLCNFDRKYQLSIQFSVWDKIKELDKISKQCMTNLAQLLIHLFMEKGLPLSVLKIIQFSELNKHALRFMRQILLAIIMNADLQSSLEVFYRISKAPKLHMFRESIRLFIQHFLIKNAAKKSSVLSDEEMVTLKKRALEVDKILTSHESKLRF